MNGTLEEIELVLMFVSGLYVIPYLIRLGWEHANNRTKKVCDVCFRDIKKFNEEWLKNKSSN